MSEMRVIRSVGVEREGEGYFFSYEEGPPPPDHFRLATLYTGISSGTELTFLHGTNPYLHASWDENYGLFRSGEPGMHYPVPFMGYMEVGLVTESRAASVREGEIMAMTYGHKSGHTANAFSDFFMRLPDEIDPILGIYVGQMGPICANGILHADAEMVGRNVQRFGEGVAGRNIVVMGAGVVGLLTALFARYHGAAEVVVANNSEPRLKAAQALGLTCIAEVDGEPSRYCKERWHHGGQDRGADLVFQCKASAASLNEALRCLRPQGTVIDMAFYQGGASDLRLGEEFHHNGLGIRSAQIGHVPLGLERTWTRQRLAHETLELLRAVGPSLKTHLITDVVPFDKAPAFLAQMAATYRPEVIQAVIEVPEHVALLDGRKKASAQSSNSRNGNHPMEREVNRV